MRDTNSTIIAALGRGGVCLAAALLLAAGCNLRPPVPRTRTGRRVKAVPVNPADPVEVEGVKALKGAAAEYRQALKVLHAHYIRIGAFDKEKWSQQELENLNLAQPWQFVGVDAPPPPAAGSLEGVTQAALVEQVIAARTAWQGALRKLAAHYRQKGMDHNLRLIGNVQRRYLAEHVYDYFLTAEIPPATLRPTEVIAEADALFAQALRLHRRGKPVPLVTSYPKQRRALGMFRELVQRFPTSTQIARSAYYIGEIYKEYFDEDVRAVHWYERAWQWDRNIQLPARSQAAFVYDIRLAQYQKALRLYHEVIKYEHFAPDRIRYAYQRIEELNAKRK